MGKLDIVNGVFMTIVFVASLFFVSVVWGLVPDHDGGVKRSGGNLFVGGGEVDGGDGVVVAAALAVEDGFAHFFVIFEFFLCDMK